MFDTENAKIAIQKLEASGVKIVAGLWQQEINLIEDAYGIVLPEDLKCLLSVGVPVGEHFPDWHGNPQLLVQESRESINAAFSFDIKENNYWCDLFGAKPDNNEQAISKALDVIADWPPLIRIYAHRYMATDHPTNNPILSVHQATDSIYYGYNLADYLFHEFNITLPIEKPKDPPVVSKWGDAFDLLNEVEPNA
ncbi:MAG TPA: hypothetical protein VD735_04440 [Candidatus Saccharimonadales bacterium]|nr:hypothetical protein [Candidatus Saccharimonadales bacterium]